MKTLTSASIIGVVVVHALLTAPTRAAADAPTPPKADPAKFAAVSDQMKEFIAKNTFQIVYTPFDWTLNDLTGRGGR